ncbi:MAG: PBP1A family penicillin-binding protein [Methylobacterium sp.]|nr:PBP1A family penicillin-binding protein [Methylobacterium sp.]MCA3639051.1 PBP1A family penicillin-binding protein [Methylobacterium sp.]
MARGRAGGSRREPRFDDDGGYASSELRLAPEDRDRRTSRRPEPPADHEPPRRGRDRHRRGKGRRGFFGTIFYWSLTLALWGAIALAGIIGYFAMKLPPIDQLAVPKRPPNVAILAADGTLIANRGETGGANVPFGELPRYLPMAFVSIEDRRFYSHFGIDPVGLARAVVRNASSGRAAEGGSTLTQQLAKNLFLTQERTLSRKIQEALLSIWLERNYSKDQILELYMNRVYFGSGAYGVEAASQRYFGKSARALTLGEAAVLAGLVQSPSRLAPNRNPEGAAERAALVLAKMVEQGHATPEMVKLARTNTTEARKRARPGAGNYVADWVMDVLDDHIGTIDRDIVVKTTIDPRLQGLAEKVVATEFEQKRLKLNVDQIAMVAMSPDGAVRALVGGRDYAQSQFNRAVMARRQPGSSFKPFVYLAALEKGLTPDTIREDGPVNIKGWKPENYSREYYGSVTLQQALAMSLNTIPAKLIMEIGPRTVVRTAQRLGISSGLRADASLALGTSEVTPMEMTTAYAAFANGGTGVIPHAIIEVKGTDGTLIYRRQPQNLGQVAEPATIGALNRMMRETLVSGTARKSDLPGWQAAGKTGTTQEHKDAWFLGYTAHLVAGFWVGNDEGDLMRKVTGSGLPAELWASFMREAHGKVPPQPLPGLNEGGWLGVGNGMPVAQQPAGTRHAPGGDSPMRLEGPSTQDRSLLSRLFGG